MRIKQTLSARGWGSQPWFTHLAQTYQVRKSLKKMYLKYIYLGCFMVCTSIKNSFEDFVLKHRLSKMDDV